MYLGNHHISFHPLLSRQITIPSLPNKRSNALPCLLCSSATFSNTLAVSSCFRTSSSIKFVPLSCALSGLVSVESL
ncbi:hypothetical protein K440DRAFT_383008 [Wilcoxina mikolae CBS 423.85]|nr:hypothetical protein K440DRAFT_383008 [Wilcoxina mikolae CBS 423.85]